MDAEAVRLTQARWILGLLQPEQLVEFACDALAADVDTPSLRVLAGETDPTRDAIEPLFRRVSSELGLAPLDGEQAKLVVARSWALQIVAGSTSAYDGAKAIWRECCDVTGPRRRLDVFLSLASEHEDFRFAQLDDPQAYAAELQRCEQAIVAEARALIGECCE